MLFIGVFHGRSTNDNPIQKEKKVEFQEMKWNGMKIESNRIERNESEKNKIKHKNTFFDITHQHTDRHPQAKAWITI